jgi:3-oxoacyl-[acyl-carrier protein] reductase
MSGRIARLRLPGLAGRRVLVTGGSRGIGRAAVVCLAETGASVGLAYHSAHEEAERAIEEARAAARDAAPDGVEVKLWSEAGDLSRESDVERLFERVDAEFGGLDGFVGNAGVWNAAASPLSELGPSQWHEMIDVNLTSIYLTTRAAVTRMSEGGRVVLISSTAGQRGEPEHSHYAATKGAIISFCKSIATELGPKGITVNSVAPGWVDTDMSASVLRTSASERVISEIPLRRVATAEDVAGPICFLLSDLARHVTGEVVNVNGGSVLCG